MKKLISLLCAGIVFFVPSVFGQNFKNNIADFSVPLSFQNYENKIVSFPTHQVFPEKKMTTIGYHLNLNGINDGRVDVIEFYKLIPNKDNGGLDQTGEICVLYDLTQNGSFKNNKKEWYAKGDCDW